MHLETATERARRCVQHARALAWALFGRAPGARVGRAQAVAHEGEELRRQLGFSVDARVARNDSTISETILDIAVASDAELIVLGTHGATAVQPALLGSVSSAVVHQSERPFVVVPAGPARYSQPPSRFPLAIAENPQRLIRQVRGRSRGFP